MEEESTEYTDERSEGKKGGIKSVKGTATTEDPTWEGVMRDQETPLI